MTESAARVLIVGGYGHVGKLIARELIGRAHAAVRLAGRALEKAQGAASALGCEAAVLDLDKPETWEAVSEAEIVIVCIDARDGTFAGHVLSKGKLYIDITASYSIIEAVEALQGMSQAWGGTAVLSVGFAPGLTNLLTKAASERLDGAESARIGVVLGLGDAHGEAAILWTLINASEPSRLSREPTRIRIPADSKALLAYPFPFADQFVLSRTLGLKAETVLSLGNDVFTWLAFRVAPLLRGRPRAQRAIAAFLSRIRVGSDRAALFVEVYGGRAGKKASVAVACEGRREAAITAQVAALVAEHLLGSEIPNGVHHIEQVMNSDQVFAALTSRGATFTWG